MWIHGSALGDTSWIRIRKEDADWIQEAIIAEKLLKKCFKDYN